MLPLHIIPAAAQITFMIIPASTEIAYSESINKMFLFIFLVFFKSTTSPNPALVHSPAIQLPKDMLPFTKVSVITVDDAQLGISPTAAVIKG